MGIIIGSSAEPLIHFEQLETEPGIYFAEVGEATISTSQWKFIAYYNLSSYWYEGEHLRQTHDQLLKTCATNDTQYVNHCKELLQPISYLLDEITDNNELFKEHPNRVRRAPLDFVGNLLGDVFGVLNQRDAQKYSEQIEALTKGTLEMQSLYQQQTSILDLTSNILRKEQSMVEDHYRRLQSEIQSVLMQEEYLDAVFQLSMAVFIYKDIQGDLVDILSDVHHGRASTRLLPPSQLMKQLKDVYQLITSDVQVPSSKAHWAYLYKLLDTRARIIKDQVIFEVTMPLVQNGKFQIFKVIPVPTRHLDKFVYIEPQFHHVLVNEHRDWYYPISTEELNECKLWEEGGRICTLDGPLYKVSSKEEHCEISLLTHTEHPQNQCQVRAVLPITFVHKVRSNQWLMVLPNETIFDVNCNHQTRTIKLGGSGFLSMTPGCTLRGASVLMKSQVTYNTSSFSDIVPAFNLSQEIKSRAVVLESESLDDEITGLQQRVTDLKQDTKWTQLSVHHVGNYAITGVMILAVGLAAIIYLSKKKSNQAPVIEVINQGPRNNINSRKTRENLV